jgi:hypothetical protein
MKEMELVKKVSNWFKGLGDKIIGQPAPQSESYSRKLLLGEAEPPTDFMRSRELDKALDRYRTEVRRQEKRAAS